MDKQVVRKKIIKKKAPMRYWRLFKGASILLIVSTIVFLISLFRIDLLGFKYLALIMTVIGIVDFCILFVLNKRFKVVIKMPFLAMSIILFGVFSFATYNISFAEMLVDRIVSVAVKEERYEVYVLKSSKYESISELSKTDLGIYDSKSDSLDEAVKILKKHATFKTEKTYDDFLEMFKDGVDKKIEALYINSAMSDIIKEDYKDLFEQFKLLGEYTVATNETIEKSDVDVTKEPFLIYISGIDTYGSIGTVSRSDVNILMAVNPKTNKILLVNTPRDYYVKLHSKKAFDKLTHAGIYGVEESIGTLEDLYVTDVDFYFKVNFSSLVKIVDTLGGVDVDSKYNFSYDGFTFHKGKNHLSGAAALAFSRSRKELPLGDISRGENQEAVIKALIEKASSPSIISKYMSILDTMSKSFVTNMSEEDILSLAKMQLNDNPKWTVEVQNATGTDASNVTYSAGKTKLYVMNPDEDSVTSAKLKLNEILEED